MVVENGIFVTESSRDKLWRLLCFLGWSEAVVGAVVAVIVYRPTSLLSDFLPRSYKGLLYIFYGELIGGLSSVVVAIQGVLVSQASLHNPLMISTTRSFKTWLTLGIALVFSLTMALIVIPGAVEGVQNEILEVMKGGVSFYLSSLEWKTNLDKLHQQYQCCGVNSISDWYTSRWIPIRSIRPEVADLQDVLAEDGTLGERVVPASCCNPYVRMPCFHDTLQQNSSLADTRTTLRPETVFTRGCGSLVVGPVASTIGPFKVLAITILLLQTGQLVIGWYLYSSARALKLRSQNDATFQCEPSRPNLSSGSKSPTCCSVRGRPQSKKWSIFRRKQANNSNRESSFESSSKRLGKAIKCASRAMLCGLPKPRVRSSEGSFLGSDISSGRRNRNSFISTTSIQAYPVSVDTEVRSQSDQLLTVTKPLKFTKTTSLAENQTEMDLELLNLHL